LLYWVGVRAANPRVLAVSLPVLLFGLIWYLAGWKWAKGLWFACAFLLFMVPLTFLDTVVAFPLRLFVTTFAVKILNVFGMDVIQNGTAIHSVKNTFEPLDVADPCSGIRSLIALMALTAVYGYTTMDRWWKKWILFLSCIPLAVIGNLARIVTIAFVAQGFGQETAMPLYHDYSGYIVFSLAILCMLAIGTLLNVHYRELIYRWTQEEVARPPPVR
jgi:exosortase